MSESLDRRHDQGGGQGRGQVQAGLGSLGRGRVVVRRDRRVKILQVHTETLEELSRAFGFHPGWSMAGGVNIKMAAWLVTWLVGTEQLPQDAVASWVWSDPGRYCFGFLIWSETYDLVDDSTCPSTMRLGVVAASEGGDMRYMPEVRDD